MYFGSVKFFKHLILTVVFGWIAAATVLSVYFGIKCHMLTSEDKPAAADKPSIEEYVSEMNNAGYSSEEILEYIMKNDSAAFGSPSENDEQAEDASSDNIVSTPVQEEVIIEDSGSQTDVSAAAGVYSELYPELYAVRTEIRTTPSSKTVFLTFDDGPSVNTYDILFILNRQRIKGTFFMSAGKTAQCCEEMRAVAEAGHTIGVHSFSHDPSVIYSSVEDFLRDFYETYKLIYDACGVRPSVYRLADIERCPEELKNEIITEMDRRGFTLFDYNVESNDRSSAKNWQAIYDSVYNGVLMNTSNEKASIVHLHDSTDDYTTVITVEDIIIDLKKDGYSFAALDSSVDM